MKQSLVEKKLPSVPSVATKCPRPVPPKILLPARPVMAPERNRYRPVSFFFSRENFRLGPAPEIPVRHARLLLLLPLPASPLYGIRSSKMRPVFTLRQDLDKLSRLIQTVLKTKGAAIKTDGLTEADCSKVVEYARKMTDPLGGERPNPVPPVSDRA